MEYQPYTPYPQPGYEYKWWGMWGPRYSTKHMLSGALTVFIAIPLLLLGLALLVLLVLLAIAVPPVGIALLTRGDN